MSLPLRTPPEIRNRFILDRYETPVGTMLLVADLEGRLRALSWEDSEDRVRDQMRARFARQGGCLLEAGPAPNAIRERLDAYFAGDIQSIDAIEVQSGGTPFQQRVWAALRTIPAGTTSSYGELATRIGAPSAVRAVGLANGANPIALVVPCHRVIGADATLTGYGGGLERKRWLLRHEGAFFRESRTRTGN